MNRTYVLSFVIAVALIAGITLRTSASERLSLFFSPSAEKAYSLAMRHFNSLDAENYSLSTVSYFLHRAAALDPAYPYVHHQLARVYFLTARYEEALDEINIELANDKTRAPSYYMRGLIEGYLQDYDAAVRDYKQFVELDPSRWEGRTDYAWVLIKTKNFDEALRVIDTGLASAPHNPWLLSMRATILYEQGKYAAALTAARVARDAVNGITEAQWLEAYPGNAPSAAKTGIETLRTAAETNLQKAEQAAQTNK